MILLFYIYFCFFGFVGSSGFCFGSSFAIAFSRSSIGAVSYS